MSPNTGLVCERLTKQFPGTLALDHVDLAVAPGEVVVLLGENGAGKSTLVRCISGIHQPDEGSMTFDGEPYAPANPGEAIERGIGMIHQEMTLLDELSVAENIFLGRLPTRRGRVDHAGVVDRAAEVLRRVGLEIDVRTKVRRLSTAQQQLVEIAKALSLQARVLILDEPTASLGEEDTERLFTIVRDLQAGGVGFIYISHRLEEVARIGDRVVVLRDGARVAAFDDATTPVDTFVEAMVGRSVDEVHPDPAPPGEEVVLEVTDLHREGAFRDVNFTLRRGEILGIAGLVGAGRTEVARAIFGAEPPDGGTMSLRGQPYAPSGPDEAVRNGVVLVPEDRKSQGLVLDLTLADNLALPSLAQLGPVVRQGAVDDMATQASTQLQIKGRPGQSARTLSGGNQQKAVIGKWLPRDPQVVLFDEPTRGVDVGAKRGIHDLIRQLAADGTAVIVISSELTEVLGLSHRVLVMSHGRQTAIVDRVDATEEVVMTHAVAEGTR